MPQAEVWFYHLERSSLDQVLPELQEKTLARGWRAVVRPPTEQMIERLDQWLWTYRDDSFLPHGPAAEPGASRQPIVLTAGPENPNQAQALFLVDGSPTEDMDGYERCIVLFDGADESALAKARSQWKAVKASGATVSYWKQQARGWEKQA